MLPDLSLRGSLVTLHEASTVIMQQHDYPSAIKSVLSEILLATIMLSAITKGDGVVTLQIQPEEGALKLLSARCTRQFGVRALAQWEGENELLDVNAELPGARLMISYIPQRHGHGYQGIVQVKGTSIAEAVEGYCHDSIQLPTRIIIMSQGSHTAGVLLQMMPTSDQSIHTEEDLNTLNKLAEHVKTINLLHCKTPDDLALEYTVRSFIPYPIKFVCTCSIERSESAVLMMDPLELDNILAESQCVAVKCEFCGANYEFTREQIDLLRERQNNPLN